MTQTHCGCPKGKGRIQVDDLACSLIRETTAESSVDNFESASPMISHFRSTASKHCVPLIV